MTPVDSESEEADKEAPTLPRCGRRDDGGVSSSYPPLLLVLPAGGHMDMHNHELDLMLFDFYTGQWTE